MSSDGEAVSAATISASRHSARRSRKAPTAIPPAAKQFKASVYSYPEQLPTEFSSAIIELEKEIGAPVWLLVQNGPPDDDFADISFKVYKGFHGSATNFGPENACLLIESPGGQPDQAFRICRLFQRRCKRLTVVVAQWAKSAATMMAMGADRLILAQEAELGPLDLQVFDREQERMDSALNAVQALERVNAYGMVAMDQAMALLVRRMHKRTDVLLPIVLDYVASTLKPLLEKIDTIDYARKSRQLKVVEEYAARLMRRQYGFPRAKQIARQLVENYPEHGFVIDRDELLTTPSQDPEESFGVGIKAERATAKTQAAIDRLLPYLDVVTAIGRLEEI